MPSVPGAPHALQGAGEARQRTVVIPRLVKGNAQAVVQHREGQGVVRIGEHCPADAVDQQRALDAGDAHARGSKSKTATLLGTIYKSDTGYVLITGKTKYNLGGQDFSKFLGKKVKVRGIYTKGEKGRVLEVTKIEEAKPSKKK